MGTLRTPGDPRGSPLPVMAVSLGTVHSALAQERVVVAGQGVGMRGQCRRRDKDSRAEGL